jgi:hypothetical protein
MVVVVVVLLLLLEVASAVCLLRELLRGVAGAMLRGVYVCVAYNHDLCRSKLICPPTFLCARTVGETAYSLTLIKA